MAESKSTLRRLTKTTIDALVSPSQGHVITWDADLKGFGVRVSEAGTRTYFVQKRLPNGRQVKATIGRHGQPWTVEQARTRAKRLLGAIAAGDDPAAERRAARAAERERRDAPTVADLAERYLAEHVEVHNKPSTQAEVRRIVNVDILPRIGRTKAAALTRADVIGLHREMRATPRHANHVLAILSKMLNLAELWGLRADGSNPCRHVKRYPERQRDRFLSGDELERLGTALRHMEAEGALPPAVTNVIKLLVFTGMRLGEVTGLTWGMVDHQAGVLRLPDAKAGARIVPLGAPALALLASLERGPADAPIFPVGAARVERAWAGEKEQAKGRKKARLGVRDRAGIPDARLHDLRHTLGTYAGGAGLNQFLVRDLLGHKTMAMAGRYVSKHVDPLLAAANVVSGQIAAALEGKPLAEVVALRRGG